MSDARRILVTGAGGFIGGRISEVLHTLGIGSVRAAQRRWSSGARIGRFPVDLIRCDIRDPRDVSSALEGITHVVHCAVGDRSTTIDGTRTLLQGALAAGVARIVHLSTVDVYGTPTGDVDERQPLTQTGREYGDTKIEAERVCQDMASRGLPVTILRPTLVHGPFSATWTVAYAQRLGSRPWLVAESDAQGTCNLVYVDDLVGAVISALDAPVPTGEVFNINGPERPTWHAYFSALNDAMGLPPLQAATPTSARIKAGAMLPVRSAAKFAMKHFQGPVMAAYQRFPLARVVMKEAEARIKRTPAPSEFEVYSRKVSYSTAKAERLLAFKPRFPLAEALPLTAAWLRHHRYVKNGAR